MIIVHHLENSRSQPNLDTHLSFVESRMKGRQWFVGDRFSAADVQMTFPLERGGPYALMS